MGGLCRDGHIYNSTLVVLSCSFLFFYRGMLRDLNAVLQSLKPSTIMYGDPEAVLCVDIRRDNVVRHAIREGQKRKFDPLKLLKVCMNAK